MSGVLVLGGGIVLMARGVLTNGESRRLLPFALGAACATAGYTLSDGMGARASGAPVAYVAWLMLLLAVSYTPAVLALRGRRILTRDPRTWALGSLGAAASFGAYAIAVWAMTVAPIALVGALRETSILFAVLIGWLAFGERMDRGKALAAALILGGVALGWIGLAAWAAVSNFSQPAEVTLGLIATSLYLLIAGAVQQVLYLSLIHISEPTRPY